MHYIYICNLCLMTVKQVGTDATYTGIVIAGIAVTGTVQWIFEWCAVVCRSFEVFVDVNC